MSTCEDMLDVRRGRVNGRQTNFGGFHLRGILQLTTTQVCIVSHTESQASENCSIEDCFEDLKFSVYCLILCSSYLLNFKAQMDFEMQRFLFT